MLDSEIAGQFIEIEESNQRKPNYNSSSSPRYQTMTTSLNDDLNEKDDTDQSLDLKFRIEYERTIQRLLQERIDPRMTNKPDQASRVTYANMDVNNRQNSLVHISENIQSLHSSSRSFDIPRSVKGSLLSTQDVSQLANNDR